ncbi:hypothetical protein COT62_00635 [Candidatus Roizmanbacteria bacterium CG09_land_8_20_14_0_10_41_9]|uniref:Sortase n=1 Tax=Candidatus Roizmanbacteria bacterium CG09_land_8_20_14_0_10_41_9 TaxID=1974850 RepID=A0A2H0WVQ8_9BACT|nr:MAG: hypothetical protein COT62_00635 [Candidatus Roizmanbacteria bacterium CG09_land_8_20_14_0_10_41_9]
MVNRIHIWCFFCFISFIFFPKPVLGFEFHDHPTKIIIPTLRISLPVSTSKVTYNTWEVSHNKASFGETTAVPGMDGNTVVFAHSMPHLFGDLPKIRKGDQIYLFTDQDWFTYVVFDTYTVQPDDIKALSRKQGYELTLYTCVGKNYQQRFVVKARLTTTILPHVNLEKQKLKSDL